MSYSDSVTMVLCAYEAQKKRIEGLKHKLNSNLA